MIYLPPFDHCFVPEGLVRFPRAHPLCFESDAPLLRTLDDPLCSPHFVTTLLSFFPKRRGASKPLCAIVMASFSRFSRIQSPQRPHLPVFFPHPHFSPPPSLHLIWYVLETTLELLNTSPYETCSGPLPLARPFLAFFFMGRVPSPRAFV